MIKFLERIKTLIKIVKIYKNFLLYFINRLGFYPQSTLILFLRNGVKYKIRNKKITSADYYVINESWVHRIHDSVKKYLKNGAIVMDIGAHIGSFSIFAASQAKNIKVYGFEPILENFNLLEENINLNNFDKNIKVFSKAVAGVEGKRKIFLAKKDTGQHTFFKKPFGR